MKMKGYLGVFVALAASVLAWGQGIWGKDFCGARPLWEPGGSPVLLLPGDSMYPPVDTPRAMCMLDADGDGSAELIVGGDYLHILSVSEGRVYENYLTAYVGIKKPVGPGDVVLDVLSMGTGDLDGDGLEDLVVATESGELWVLLNHGRWGFQWARGSPYQVGAAAIWTFDHDGDGDLDVLLGTFDAVRLLRGNGKGGLGKPEELRGLEGRVLSGAAGEYKGSPGFYVLTDRGLWFFPRGELQGIRVLERGGKGLAAGDFNGDGYGDIALGRGDAVWVYPGGAEGFGEPQEFPTDHGVFQLFVADLNGDGWEDLVAGAYSPGGFSLLYNLVGKGFIGPYRQGVDIPAMRGLPPSTPLMAVGDANGDGMADVAVGTMLGYVSFFLSGKSGRSLQGIPGSFLLGSGDLNGDGSPDLLSSTPRGGVAALLNSGHGAFRGEPLVGPSGEDRMPYLAVLGDVTGDGVEELVVFEFASDTVTFPQPGKPYWEWEREESNARITVWDLKGKEVLWSEPLGERIRPVLVLSDQTGDGVSDVVTGVGEKAVILSYTPDGPKRLEVPWGGEVGPLVGLSDGTVAGFRVGQKVELLLLRRGKLLETGISLGFAPLDLLAVDLDGDGKEDLVSLGWGAVEGKLEIVAAVLWGEEEGRFRPELYPIPGWPATSIPFPYGGLAAGDLDGDGKPELAAMRLPDREGNPGGIVVIPWGEAGPGEPELLPGCVGTKLLALDVDGDGRAELLSVQTGTPPWLCLTTWR